QSREVLSKPRTLPGTASSARKQELLRHHVSIVYHLFAQAYLQDCRQRQRQDGVAPSSDIWSAFGPLPDGLHGPSGQHGIGHGSHPWTPPHSSCATGRPYRQRRSPTPPG
ncbi:unnamed protein product, partial [Ascophyllum nodosum]